MYLTQYINSLGGLVVWGGGLRLTPPSPTPSLVGGAARLSGRSELSFSRSANYEVSDNVKLEGLITNAIAAGGSLRQAQAPQRRGRGGEALPGRRRPPLNLTAYYIYFLPKLEYYVIVPRGLPCETYNIHMVDRRGGWWEPQTTTPSPHYPPP